MKKDLIAKELLRVAKTLLAFQGEEEVKKDLQKIKEAKKKWQDISKDFDANISELQKQIDALQKTKSAFQAQKKQQFKEFDKTAKVTQTLKGINATLTSAVRVGQSLDQLVSAVEQIDSEFSISSSKSKQPAYKQAWEVLVSTLTGSEYQKYVKRIQASFKKNIVEIKTGVDQMKSTAKSWDKDFEEFHRERKQEWDARNPNNPMPKLVKASIRQAGFKDVIFGIGKWIRQKYKKLVGAFENILKNSFGMQKDLQNAEDRINEMIDCIKKVS